MAVGNRGQASINQPGITELVEWAKTTKSAESGDAGVYLHSARLSLDHFAWTNPSSVNEFAVAWHPRRTRASLATFRAQRQTGCPVLAGRP